MARPRKPTLHTVQVDPQAIDTAANALVSIAVGALDSERNGRTLQQAVIAFATALPVSLHGKSLPDANVDVFAKRASDAVLSTYGVSDYKDIVDPELRERVTKKVGEVKSRTAKLFRCAPCLPAAYGQGLTGTWHDVLRFCTTLQKHDYDVPKTFAAIAAAENLPKDLKADAEAAVQRILKMDGEHRFLTALAKAALVDWCDDVGLTPKDINTYRNRALLN